MIITPISRDAWSDAQRAADTALLALQCILTMCKSLSTDPKSIEGIRVAQGLLADVQHHIGQIRLSPQSPEH